MDSKKSKAGLNSELDRIKNKQQNIFNMAKDMKDGKNPNNRSKSRSKSPRIRSKSPESKSKSHNKS